MDEIATFNKVPSLHFLANFVNSFHFSSNSYPPQKPAEPVILDSQ